MRRWIQGAALGLALAAPWHGALACDAARPLEEAHARTIFKWVEDRMLSGRPSGDAMPRVVRADMATEEERRRACPQCAKIVSAFFVPETGSVLIPEGSSGDVLVHEFAHFFQFAHFSVTRENFDDQDEADARAVQEAFKKMSKEECSTLFSR